MTTILYITITITGSILLFAAIGYIATCRNKKKK